MRKLIIGMAVLTILLVSAAYLAADEKPWFDMENCAFCKNLTAEEGLMENFQKWEHFKVDNGTITISVVNDSHVDAFIRAGKNMEKTAMRMKKGEQLQMCGMCESYGALMMAGAKMADVQSGNIFVSTMNSDNPETVKLLHAHADKTTAEMKMWEEKEKMEKDAHEGHDHSGHEGHDH